MKSHKSLTYDRTIAYLRIKLRDQPFNKKRYLFVILLYFLCSLSLFLLPLDILTKYPYLKHFTDFMDFIPAIKLMETKTFAPELCKFYASYMFVLGVICLVNTSWQGFISFIKKSKKIEKKIIEKLRGHPIKEAFLFMLYYIMTLYFPYEFLSGGLIGASVRRHSSEYFIYGLFDMIFYIDFWQFGSIWMALMLMVIPVIIKSLLSYNKLYKQRKDK